MHGVIVCNSFYDKVSRHDVEGRSLAEEEAEKSVALELSPKPQQDM